MKFQNTSINNFLMRNRFLIVFFAIQFNRLHI